MGMPKRIQAKHIRDEQILAVIDSGVEMPACPERGEQAYHRDHPTVFDITAALGLPMRVVQAKLRSLERRRLATGCVTCGCTGWERQEANSPR